MAASYLDRRFADLPSTLTAGQLADLFGKTTKTIYAWERTGRIPAWPIGDGYVVFRDELREFMEERRANMLAGNPVDEELELSPEEPE